MSKRNLTLLIIILIIIVIVVFGFLNFRKTNPPTDDTGGTNFGFDFNPFNNKKPTTPTPTPPEPTDVSGFIPTPEPVAQDVKLKKVSTMPVAGFGIFVKERFKDAPVIAPTNSSTPANIEIPVAIPPPTTTKPTPPPTEFAGAVRYVARATGNIYQTFADKIEERKFSTTIIPKVYEAYFGNKGESVIMRYLKGGDRAIETFVGILPKELLGEDTTENNEVKGVFLPENITDISISPDTIKIFYLFNSGDGVVGTTADALGNKKVQVFDSAYTEWLSSWPNIKMITLNTKPSGGVLGYLYAFDPSRKELNKILGDINGLTTLTSPNGKLILYSNSDLSLNIFHIDTRNSGVLGVKTLSDKCVWGKANDSLYCAVPKFINGALYPDAWYKGEVSFSDAIWKIDLKTGNTTMIADGALIGSGEEVDATKLALDDGENYLFFVNKKDSFLWELNLK